jgi:hypothetical protein
MLRLKISKKWAANPMMILSKDAATPLVPPITNSPKKTGNWATIDE